MTAPTAPPFKEGEIVRIKGNDHLGPHRVDSCEWFTLRPDGAEPYWLCECTEIREPIDWSKIPAGATGIVVGSQWRGPSTGIEHVACECCGGPLRVPDRCPACDDARTAGERFVAKHGLPEGLTHATVSDSDRSKMRAHYRANPLPHRPGEP